MDRQSSCFLLSLKSLLRRVGHLEVGVCCADQARQRLQTDTHSEVPTRKKKHGYMQTRQHITTKTIENLCDSRASVSLPLFCGDVQCSGSCKNPRSIRVATTPFKKSFHQHPATPCEPSRAICCFAMCCAQFHAALFFLPKPKPPSENRIHPKFHWRDWASLMASNSRACGCHGAKLLQVH